MAAHRHGRQWDESNVRTHPGRGSRLRTKDCPSHAGAQWGMMVIKDRGRWGVILDNTLDTAMTCTCAREFGCINIIVGDRASAVDDVSDREDTLACIVKLTERSTVSRRTAGDNDPYERIVVANAGLLLIVRTAADSEPRTGSVERALAVVYAGGVRPVLRLTKSDLADPQKSIGEFSALGVDVVVCGISDDLVPLSELTDVPGRVTALAGYSGVGKSTLVNRIVPEANRETGEISGVDKGRHTSTQSVALMLPSESAGDVTSWIIDTPGTRSFGLVYMIPEALLAASPNIQAMIDEYPRGCTHLGSLADPECALDKLEGVQHRRAMVVYRLLSAIGDNEDWELDIERDQPH